MKVVHIFTDGACRGNPGPGGWAVLFRSPDSETPRELSGGDSNTTNNRMELMAIIMALEALEVPHIIILTTDSEYVRKGITEWIVRWKGNGWRTSNGNAVKNRDLWERLDNAAQHHTIDWRWVRGHAGNPDNERVDALAVAAIPDD
jgi:ribonuclease HI